MSTKTTNLIKTCTNLKEALKVCKFKKKLDKLSCAEKLRHNEFNKLKFQLKTNYTQNVYLKQCKYTVYNIMGTCSVRLNVCDFL